MHFASLRASLAVAALITSGGAFAVPYGSNLIIGGDAESGTGAWTAYPGTGLFQSVDYGPNWVQPTQPGPADRGAKLFVGGNQAYVAGYQTLDLSAEQGRIATGGVGYQLEGWLGGWSTQGDNAMLYVTFLDMASNLLGSAALGPVTPADRDNTSGLIYQATSGLLPMATTQVVFALSMERLNPSDNDGYADNLSFVMAPVPEPQTYALMLAGLTAVGAIVRRSNRQR